MIEMWSNRRETELSDSSCKALSARWLSVAIPRGAMYYPATATARHSPITLTDARCSISVVLSVTIAQCKTLTNRYRLLTLMLLSCLTSGTTQFGFLPFVIQGIAHFPRLLLSIEMYHLPIYANTSKSYLKRISLSLSLSLSFSLCVCVCVCVCLCHRSNGHFPGEPGLALT